MPLELESLGIDEEWRMVMHTCIERYQEIKRNVKTAVCLMFVFLCFLFCTAPLFICIFFSVEREFINLMKTKCEEANERCRRRRIRFSSGKRETHRGRGDQYWIKIEWEDGGVGGYATGAWGGAGPMAPPPSYQMTKYWRCLSSANCSAYVIECLFCFLAGALVFFSSIEKTVFLCMSMDPKTLHSEWSFLFCCCLSLALRSMALGYVT